MSGGPVFDSRGRVCAIVTSSFEGAPGEESTPTYAAHLYPVLPAPMNMSWPSDFAGRRNLLELDPKFCDIERRQAFQQTVDADGRPALFYSGWT
jgi:hypothetical protein